MTRAASVALLLSALVAGCPGSITNPTDAGTGGGSATGGGTSATGGGTSSTGGGSATGGGGSATGGGGSATGGGGSATGGGGGATGGGSATGGGTTDAGHFTFDGGPPDLSCLADAGLTANETEIIQLPQDTWLTLPNTDFSTFCHAHEDPSVNANEGCDAVIDDWSGGMFDDGNRLMVLFGGGHGGYYGNEVYGFDLATRAWKLLRTATPLDGGQTPSEPMYDGTPVSRHTYDGLVYLSDARQMLVFGGASAPMGYSVNTTWFFDLAQHTWSQRSDGPGSSAGHYHMGMAYDLATHTVYMRDDQGIWSYDAVQDT